MADPKESTPFLGTYFDRDVVLRLERWTRLLAWAILVVYLIQAGYDAGMNIYNSRLGGYPLDWYFFLMTLTRPLQGAMLAGILYLAGKATLILMDIEENTRRATRQINLREK